MFSKEWFFYVFGRWVVISGIAGAIVQYLFTDTLGLKTIPAFLLNQFCLACVFWYVDRLIFKKHFSENLLSFFHFPRIKTTYGLKEQFDKVSQEYEDLKFKITQSPDKPQAWLNEFVDLEHTVEMMERLLRERNIDIDREYDRVAKENLKKGYYFPRAKEKKSTGRKPSRFLETLEKEILLCDGAMGTYLRSKGFGADVCLEALNLEKPGVVKGIHAEYIEAGARIIETNTFEANRFKLEKYGLAGKVRQINIMGARIAKEASAGRVFVAGSVGNLGRLISPYGEVSLVDAHDVFSEQIRSLAEGGADIILLETMTSFLEAKEVVLVCKEISDLPIICQLTFTDEGVTLYGDRLADCFYELEKLGADVVGLNCSLGPRMMIKLLKSLPPHFKGKISVQPNADLPRYKDGSSEYSIDPQYFMQCAQTLKTLA